LALDYLADHQVMSLATYGPEGVWNAAVFYANREFDLYFLSAGHTRHARNFAGHPRTAVTIQEDYKDWPAIQGIQLEGVVHLLEGTERENVITHYTAKYPFIAGADEQIQRGLARVNWYCLTPDRLYFIDNSKGLGHRDEIAL
jgi:uncharacterized protein YhbP (UPF0306 family)